MKNTLAALSAMLILLSACQKEPSFEDPNSTPPNPSPASSNQLLVRSVQVQGNDSIVTTYSYDASKKLIKLEINFSPVPESHRLIRNAAGIITQIISKGEEIDPLGIDSVVTNVFYDAALFRYTRTYLFETVGTGSFSDSTVFAYDAAGSMVSKSTFFSSSLGDTQRYRVDYTYGAGNLASSKHYDYDTATAAFSLSHTEMYGYDNKTNPLQLGVEAMLFNYGYGFGVNNMTRLDHTDYLNPSQGYSVENTYTYNTASYPVNATSTYNPGTPVSRTLRLYYN